MIRIQMKKPSRENGWACGPFASYKFANASVFPARTGKRQTLSQTPTLPPSFLVMTMVAERGRRRLLATETSAVAVASVLYGQ